MDRASRRDAFDDRSLIDRHYNHAKTRRDAGIKAANQAAQRAIERNDMVLPAHLLDEARRALNLIHQIESQNLQVRCKGGRTRANRSAPLRVKLRIRLPPGPCCLLRRS